MKLPLVLVRARAAVRNLRAGCFICHGNDARWTSANAQALAAKHHDRTGHATWCEIAETVRYGRYADDPRQTDLEDAIASASSRGLPDSAPAHRSDASTAATVDVSAPQGRPVETCARGFSPETSNV